MLRYERCEIDSYLKLHLYLQFVKIKTYYIANENILLN